MGERLREVHIFVASVRSFVDDVSGGQVQDPFHPLSISHRDPVMLGGDLLLDASCDEEGWMACGVLPVGRPVARWVGFEQGAEPEVVAAQGVDVGRQRPVIRTDLTSQR